MCIDEADLLRDIQRLLKRELDVEQVPGFEPDPRIPAEPIKQGRGGGRHRPQRHAGRPGSRRQSSGRARAGRSHDRAARRG